jgi:hypothetical protein
LLVGLIVSCAATCRANRTEMAFLEQLVGVGALLAFVIVGVMWMFNPALAQKILKRLCFALAICILGPPLLFTVLHSMTPVEIVMVTAVISVAAYMALESRRHGHGREQSRHRGMERTPLLPGESSTHHEEEHAEPDEEKEPNHEDQ